jgi:hypothetical protein
MISQVPHPFGSGRALRRLNLENSRGTFIMKRFIVLSFAFMIGTAAGQMTPRAAEFMQAMTASMDHMHHDMAAAAMNGDIDHDFATMMIPHHQGALDMAKAELAHGNNPVMRRLAQEILVTQTSEIDAMLFWLKKSNPQSTKGGN